MVRPAFTLVEVIVSLALLAVGALGLAASAAVAHRTLRAAELQERAARHAAALIDSIAFSDVVGEDSVRIDDIALRWRAEAAVAGVTRVYATSPLPSPVTLEFATRRLPRLPVRTP